MAKYTVTIKTILDSGYNLFDFSYPIFDENYRGVIQTKFTNRFMFREIGFETVGLFKHYLMTRLNEIMPMMNQHYEANLRFKDFDPYKNKDFTQEDTRTSTGQNTSKSEGSSLDTSKSDGTSTFNDTPTTKLGTKDYATSITNDSGTGSNESSNEGTSEGNFTSTDTYLSHQHGHDGMKYPSDILNDLRKTFNNVDVMILDNLEDLFMGIY